MNKLDTSKKIILLISLLCLAGAVLLLVMMPKPEKKLPPLPEASYTYDIFGTELHKDGYREISKVPRISFEYEHYYTARDVLNAIEKNDFSRFDFPLEEGQNATFMINSCEVTLAARDYISYRSEGIYTIAETSYSDIYLVAHTVDLASGREITFTDVVSDINKFVKAFAKGKFTMVKNDKFLDDESNLEMMTNYSPENGIYPDWYVDGENFIIIARAPSAMGGLTEYKISLIEAEEFLNTDCALINMIFTGK